MNSILSANPYCKALCRASLSRVRSLSMAMTAHCQLEIVVSASDYSDAVFRGMAM